MPRTVESERARKREYYLRNREEILAKTRARDLANPEKARERQLRYRTRHSERVNARDREYRISNPGKARATKMRYRHGLFIEPDYSAMWEAQGGCCYLCGLDLAGRDVIIEHDHRCCPEGRSCRNCRRGLACRECNTAIGLARDDPDRLRRMADALEAAQQRVVVDVQPELLQETGT